MSIIGLKKSNCRHCYKCVKVCPVKSVKIEDEQAKIIERDCILCGSCLSACPQNAKTLFSDVERVQSFIQAGERVVVSLAPSFPGSFRLKQREQLAAAIKRLGFFGCGETSDGAAYVTAEYDRLLAQGDGRAMITTCCPAVNDLVEKYYPDLVGHMAPVITPMIAHGKLLKERFGRDTRVVFVGPCIAKKGEMADIRHDSQVDAVLTFGDLDEWFRREGIVPAELEPEPFLNLDTQILRLYPVAGGILETLRVRGANPSVEYLAVDGVERCKEMLETIRAGGMEGCFIEMNACSGGCVNGPVRVREAHSSFAAEVDIRRDGRAHRGYPETPIPIEMHKTFMDRSAKADLPSPEVVKDLLHRIGKDSPEQELNCGACGYASCRDKVIAVYQGKAELNMCVPYMRERAESLANYVLAETPNATVIVDNDLNIVEYNASAEKLFGKPRHEVLGHGLYELIDVSDFLDVLEHKRSIANKKVAYGEYGITTEQNIVYIDNNAMAMGIFKDITQEEKAKAEKHQLRMETVDMAQKVIDKQMIAAQQIASLLGETTAETKVTLSKLKQLMIRGDDA